MLKITIFSSSISWQVSKQDSKSVSYIQSVRNISCELVTVNYRKAFWSPFWGSWGRRRTLVDGSFESPCRVLVKRIELLFLSLTVDRGATRQNVSKLAAFRSG